MGGILALLIVWVMYAGMRESRAERRARRAFDAECRRNLAECAARDARDRDRYARIRMHRAA